jgi:uncharacterized membrane protein YfcA
MLTHISIMIVALLASILTFFSGFGLGTILMPTMAIFFPVAVAIVLTGIVHFLNGSFKVFLLRKHIHLPTLWRFGLLAIPSAFLGAWLLTRLEGQTDVFDFSFLGKAFTTTPIKLTVGLLMVAFAFIESIPRLKNITIDQKYLPLGGIISGFFGGLTGNQGAFRSMFLIRSKLTKEQFIATGSAFSFIVDLTRLSVYFKNISKLGIENNLTTLAMASSSALVGVLIGNRLLKKFDMKFIRYLVASTIFILGVLITLGVI